MWFRGKLSQLQPTIDGVDLKAAKQEQAKTDQDPVMPLTGKHFRRIQDALLEAYDDFALKQMVRFELDDSLDRIAGQGNLEQRVFGLIDWADRAGRVDELVQAACRHNDSSPALKALLAEWPQITGQMQPAQPGEGRRIDVQYCQWAARILRKEIRLPTGSELREAGKSNVVVPVARYEWTIGKPHSHASNGGDYTENYSSYPFRLVSPV